MRCMRGKASFYYPPWVSPQYSVIDADTHTMWTLPLLTSTAYTHTHIHIHTYIHAPPTPLSIQLCHKNTQIRIYIPLANAPSKHDNFLKNSECDRMIYTHNATIFYFIVFCFLVDRPASLNCVESISPGLSGIVVFLRFRVGLAVVVGFVFFNLRVLFFFGVLSVLFVLFVLFVLGRA